MHEQRVQKSPNQCVVTTTFFAVLSEKAPLFIIIFYFPQHRVFFPLRVENPILFFYKSFIYHTLNDGEDAKPEKSIFSHRYCSSIGAKLGIKRNPTPQSVSQVF